MAKKTKSSSSKKSQDMSMSNDSIESSIESFVLSKTPKLPKEIRELVVKIAPWLVLVNVLVMLPAVFFLFGFGRAMVGWSMATWSMMGVYHWGWSYQLSMWLSALEVVLMILAISGLFARKLQGWRLVYYSVWVSVFQNVLAGNILGGLIGVAISFYLLFQVKGLYKD